MRVCIYTCVRACGGRGRTTHTCTCIRYYVYASMCGGRGCALLSSSGHSPSVCALLSSSGHSPSVCALLSSSGHSPSVCIGVPSLFYSPKTFHHLMQNNFYFFHKKVLTAYNKGAILAIVPKNKTTKQHPKGGKTL